LFVRGIVAELIGIRLTETPCGSDDGEASASARPMTLSAMTTSRTVVRAASFFSYSYWTDMKKFVQSAIRAERRALRRQSARWCWLSIQAGSRMFE
jgi:hypothetical protein